MKPETLVAELRRMKVQTGSLQCLGCGHEHNCGVHGCALIRAAADMIEWLNDFDPSQSRKLLMERDAALAKLTLMHDDMRSMAANGVDFCMFCAHFCGGGKPIYSKEETYMEFCEDCDAHYSSFKWRGLEEES